MISIGIISSSKKQLIFFLEKYLLDFRNFKYKNKIELCLHSNEEELKKSEINSYSLSKIKCKISYSLKKNTFQDKYKSLVDIASEKYVLIISDHDKINFKNFERLITDLSLEKKYFMSILFKNNYFYGKEIGKINKFSYLNMEQIPYFYKRSNFIYFGNIVFNRNFLKYILLSSHNIKTNFPHASAFLNSSINNLSVFYDKPIISSVIYSENFKSINVLNNKLDLMRVFSKTINNLSINKLSIKLFAITLDSFKLLMYSILINKKEIFNKKKYSQIYSIQSFINNIIVYLNTFFIFILTLKSNFYSTKKNKNSKKSIIAIMGSRRYYSVFNSCKNKIKNLIFITDVIFNRQESKILSLIIRSKTILAKINRRTLKDFGRGEKIIRFNNQFLRNLLIYNIHQNKNHKTRILSYVENSQKFSNLVSSKKSIYKNEKFNFIYSCNSMAAPLFLEQRSKTNYLILEQTIVPYFYQKKVIEEELKNFPDIYDSSEYFYDGKNKNIEKYYSQMEFLEWELADYILCPSDFVKKIIQKSGISEKKLIKLDYGIDNTLFKKIRKNKLKQVNDVLYKKRLNILFIGEFGLRKGAIYTINAFKDFGEEKFSLKIAGNFDMKKSLKKSSNVELLGHCSFEKLKELLSWADIFIMPSLAEGSAVAGSEAICSGVPVIVTEESGIYCIDDYNGKIVKARDSIDLKDKLNYLFYNREKLKQLILNCCNESYKSLSSRIYNKKLFEFLNSLN